MPNAPDAHTPPGAPHPAETTARSAAGILAHPAVQAVCLELTERGQRPEITVLDESVHTAALAAQALGVEVGQIANSLVFDADGEPLLVLTSGAHRVDTAAVATLVGATRLRRASPEFVRTATGQAIGGVAPAGHPAPLRTLVDRWLQRYDEVWAAAGHARTVYRTTYADLLGATGGTPADVDGTVQ